MRSNRLILRIETLRPRRTAGSLLLVLLFCSGMPAQSASFNCSRAATTVEQLICTDAELGQLDETLAERYRTALRHAADQSDRLRDDQRGWLVTRDACTTVDCIADAYQDRIAQLHIGTADAFGPVSVREEPNVVEISQLGPNIELKARYPRFDPGDAAAQTANQLIAERVAAVLESFRQSYRDFLADDLHLGPPWSIEIDDEQLDPSPRLWTVDLTVFRYAGGAHPSFEHEALVFSRDDGKQLAPADLFRPESPWLQRLSELCYASLSVREPFDGDSDLDWLRKGTAPELDNYQVLLPLADGLKVIFGQYQIGPYVIGLFDVMLGYDELAPLLNPTWFGD